MKQKGVKLTGKDVMSIDIGQHTTKIVAGKLGNGTIDIKHAVSVPTPQEGFEKGRITDFNVMKKTISGAMDALKIRSRFALCSLESSEIITRELLLPLVSQDQMESMLEFEIQQYMPIELSDYTVQPKILEEVMDDGVEKARMLVTAVPKDLARNYYDLIQSINLEPLVLDIQSNAIDKLFSGGFQFNGDKDLMEQVVAVIDIGHSRINVIIFEKGKYKFNRIINLGARNINQNLANFMDVTHAEAENYKYDIEDLNKEPSIPDDSSEVDSEIEKKLRVLNIARNSIDSWIEEIERVFKYYITREAGNVIDVVYLYGGMTQMNGFEVYMQDAFGISTKIVHSLTKVNINQFSGESSLSCYLNAIGTMVRK